MERIDKLLSVSMNISRTDAGALIKRGMVSVNGVSVKNQGFKVDSERDIIECDGKRVTYNKFVYIMMNKPKGVVSASEVERAKTVVDILPDDMKRKNLFPAGRLDKDTTGFVLITDDGAFAHRILSPKNHIPKTYIATLDKPFDSQVVSAFEQGVRLMDDVCMPASLSALDGDCTRAVVTIRQGMYHQIKRMFKKFGITVTELERVKMGGLDLDKNLKSGQCRYLSPEELELIENCK